MISKDALRVLMILLWVFIAILALWALGYYLEDKPADDACKELGYERAITTRPTACEDTDGNQYYVKFRSTGFFSQNATLISVGYARVSP